MPNTQNKKSWGSVVCGAGGSRTAFLSADKYVAQEPN